MVRLSTTLILLLGFGAIPAAAQNGPCTKSEAIQADHEIDSLKDWDSIYRAYQKFSQCDDGSIAEGYSDAVGRLLGDDWKHFDRLIALAKADKRFQSFVLRHVDETVPADTSAKISRNARTRCPSGAKSLCRLIADKASAK